MKPLVYIILVNYRGLEDTIQCIESIEKIKYDNYKIVVVDNDSRDNSVQILRNQFPAHIVIEAGENLGFAGGNNVGIKLAIKDKADYVLLLNNDTIVDEHFLAKMVEVSEENSSAGIVGGKILYYDHRDTISHAGGYIDMLRFTTGHYGVGCSDEDKLFDEQREVSFISGCLMLIKSQVLEKVGLLNENYFMYYEDTDFCKSASDAGYKLIYCPHAKIYHKISKSSGGGNSPFFIKWNTRNRIIFMNKFRNRTNILSCIFSSIYVYTTRFIRLLIYACKGDLARARAIKEGIIEGRRYLREKKS